MKSVEHILLVDDDTPTNFFHKIVIEQEGSTKQVTVCKNGQEALDYLTTPQDGLFPQPDLVFLDLNMPIMDGWEFLDAFTQIPEDQKANIKIVVLTTSQNPEHIERAQNYPLVKSFQNKPLSVAKLQEVLKIISS